MKLVFALAAVFALLVAPAGAQTAPNLEGYWAAQIALSPGVGGQLTLARDGPAWRAELAGAEQHFEAADSDIRFALPNNSGAFRGALARGGAIEGFWIKPSAATDQNPDQPGALQAFATPLTLNRTGDGVWQG